MNSGYSNRKVLHNSLLLLVIASTFLFYAYSTGITGVTQKFNVGGCSCHNVNPSSNVIVMISGPGSMSPGETAQFTVTLSGGPLVRGGTNIAVSSGSLTPGGGLQKLGDELTHILPKEPSGGVVTFPFTYTAPVSEGDVIIYANGNSVNFNGVNETGDQWNYAENKIVRVSNVIVPVELTSFTASVSENNTILKWVTASEKNNHGFEVQRRLSEELSGRWSVIAFVNGAGSSVSRNEYSFTDKNLSSGAYQYRLKQVDYDGTFTVFALNETLEISFPGKFTLSQNYPNPFNPTTTIRYTIQEKEGARPGEGQAAVGGEVVRLIIYDITGGEVATLVNEVKNAGEYQAEWNAAGTASGIYYYRLQAGDYSEIKKIVLLK